MYFYALLFEKKTIYFFRLPKKNRAQLIAKLCSIDFQLLMMHELNNDPSIDDSNGLLIAFQSFQ